jgi:hypothetical protein
MTATPYQHIEHQAAAHHAVRTRARNYAQDVVEHDPP